MSVYDLVVGYPAHALAEYSQTVNQHGVLLTNWVAVCGATGTAAPHTFHTAGRARRRELCPECWPAGWLTRHPAPVCHLAEQAS